LNFLACRISLKICTAIIGSFILYSTALAQNNEINKDDILLNIEKKYAGKSFETDFRQISKLATLDITENAAGRAFFSHPGKMRWEYKEPALHEIITNGESLWIFRPEENQVMFGHASRFFKAGAGGAFLSDISLIRKNFVIRLKKATEDYSEIELVSKKKNSDISMIVIRVSQKNNEIIRAVTHNIYEDTTQFDFYNIQFKHIEPNVFEFKPFEGLNIINLD